MKLAILIPTYNEKENLGSLILNIKNVCERHENVVVHIYVIDDSSPDGTAALAEELGQQLETAKFKVQTLIRQEKEGLGKAYIYGFKKLLKSSFRPDYILQMDADQSHDPVYLHDFFKYANAGADFIVGSRYIAGGATPDWNWYRKLLSRGGNSFAKTLLGSKISDYTGGYNMYSIELIRGIDLESLSSAGYGFLIDLKHRAVQKSKKTVQVPIVFMDRVHGNSKMPANTIIKNFLLVIKLGCGKWLT